MAVRSITSSVDDLIGQWQGKFAELQKKQTAGEAVTENDVRSIILETGKSIYAANISEADVVASGHRVDEFKNIMTRVTDTKFKTSGLASGATSRNQEVNAIQLAALDEHSIARSGPPQTDVELQPLAQNVVASNGMHGRTINPLPHEAGTSGSGTSEEQVVEQAYAISRSTLEKLAPPVAKSAGSSDVPTMESSLAQAAISDQLFKIPHDDDGNNANQDLKAVIMSPSAQGPGDQEIALIRMPVQVISPTSVDPKNFSSPI